MLLAQQRVPIDHWRNSGQIFDLVTRLVDALPLDPDQSYTVSYDFTDAHGSNVAADSPEALNATVTVTTWKD